MSEFDRIAVRTGRRADLWRWSRGENGVTADGYHVRRGQCLYRRRQGPRESGGGLIDIARVGRVTADGVVIDAASETGTLRGRALDLNEWVTQYSAVPPWDGQGKETGPGIRKTKARKKGR